MARIRTIKPEFFRHEELQDIEAANPGACVMLVFAGLWGHCDSKGRFEWRPRQLKLDILPFLPFDMATTLRILADNNLVVRYSVDGKDFGEIPSFEKHQRLTGKEATEGERYPARAKEQQEHIREASGKHRGNTGEASGKDKIPRKEEGKEEKEGSKPSAPASPTAAPEKTDPPLADKPPKAEKPATDTELQAACRETWSRYDAAFRERYGTAPVVNATIRSQVKQFVQRLSYAEAPEVAAYYVGHGDGWYGRNCHAFGLALKDAEKLRTEWATGRTAQAPPARQQSIHEKRAANIAILTGATRNERTSNEPRDITAESTRIA